MTTTCHKGYLNTVAVKGKHGIALGNENGFVGTVGNKGVLAVDLAYKGTLLRLTAKIKAIRILGHFRQEIVPCHSLHNVNCQHLHGMCIKPQLLENLFETKRLLRMTGKEILQKLCQLLLRQSLGCITTFSHNQNDLIVIQDCTKLRIISEQTKLL